jgi:epoxyqueuosine reductase
MRPRAELINPALDWLAGLDAAAFKRLFRGSPLERTGLKRLRRNVAIAMGNSGDAKYLKQLKNWMLADDETLRESAAWAAERLRSASIKETHDHR